MYSGVFTALVTPFTQNNEVDYQALTDIVNFQLEQGISGLVPVGTTGESPTLSHDENMDVIEKVVKLVNKKVPVIAGTGSNCTDEALRMTKIAKHIGADASLQVAPYYNKPSQEGLYRHFMEIADNVDLPMVVYNIQGRTGVNISTETLMRLANHPNIVAVKEASGNLPQMMDVIKQKPKDFSVLSGDDNLAFPLTAIGGSGVISVASNIIPGWMEEMVQAAKKGNIEKAKTIHYELLPLFKALFLETNPLPVKYCMHLKGLVQEKYRLPLVEMNPENKEKIKNILSSLEII